MLCIATCHSFMLLGHAHTHTQVRLSAPITPGTRNKITKMGHKLVKPIFFTLSGRDKAAFSFIGPTFGANARCGW